MGLGLRRFLGQCTFQAPRFKILLDSVGLAREAADDECFWRVQRSPSWVETRDGQVQVYNCRSTTVFFLLFCFTTRRIRPCISKYGVLRGCQDGFNEKPTLYMCVFACVCIYYNCTRWVKRIYKMLKFAVSFLILNNCVNKIANIM